LQQFTHQTQAEQQWLEGAELARIRAENAQLQQTVGAVTGQLQETQQSVAHLSGQMTAQQQAAQQQLLAQQQAQALSQYDFTPEELTEQGETIDIVTKALAKQAAQFEIEMNNRLTAEQARWAQAATEPLQQKVATLEAQAAATAAANAKSFNDRLAANVAKVGLGDLKSLTANPQFQQKFAQPYGVGSSQTWGDVLQQNVEGQNLEQAAAMFDQFSREAGYHPALAEGQPTGPGSVDPTAALELPARTPTPARPPNATQAANLAKRTELTGILEARMEQANSGSLPEGWSRAKYVSENTKLRAMISAIPAE